MTDLEYITYCYESNLTDEEKQAFEKRIAEDPPFAEEVMLFLNALQAIEAQDADRQKKLFREIYDQKKPQAIIRPFRKVWYALAAAAMISGVIFGYYYLEKPNRPDQLAKQYIQDNLNSLPTTMGSSLDSTQKGVDLYNKGQYAEALHQFDAVVQSDPLHVEAQKYEGIIYLKTGDYDNAILHFRSLENLKTLHANPGKFYHALTLMERNGPGDSQEARNLLEDVVNQHLEGSQVAREWIKKF